MGWGRVCVAARRDSTVYAVLRPGLPDRRPASNLPYSARAQRTSTAREHSARAQRWLCTAPNTARTSTSMPAHALTFGRKRVGHVELHARPRPVEVDGVVIVQAIATAVNVVQHLVPGAIARQAGRGAGTVPAYRLAQVPR